jgi:molybdopterin-guanine dinucleotide biosynthesis protein A
MAILSLGGHGVKGAILAGGLGTRLFPLTKATNKHLLPVYERCLVHYAIDGLFEASRVVADARRAGDERFSPVAPRASKERS